MIRKIAVSLGMILLLSFASCGGGSSKEAKALLQKILQFRGIPQKILVNVCQDSNRNGICGSGELFTKVTINKGDDINDIWQKISLTSDGKYFLETYNPELPILVEFQDIAKVNFDDGKFTLSFNGFTTKEDDNETKEVSVLESMIDANALTKDVADKFRTLNNAEAQDKYYSALFESLETNINILRREDLDKEEAINATIKEMADETKTNQAQADKINSCENNQTCVDEEIKKVSDELVISDEEVVEIKGKQSNTNTSSNNKNDYSKYKGLQKDKEPFNRITIESDSCKNIIFDSLWLSTDPLKSQSPLKTYEKNVNLRSNIQVDVFCIDKNKKEKISSITKATFIDKNGVEHSLEDNPYQKGYNILSVNYEGDTEGLSFNRGSYYFASYNEDEEFRRISILSTSKECENPYISFIAFDLSSRYKNKLVTYINVFVLCENGVDSNPNIQYIDKAGKIHTELEYRSNPSAFDFRIEGNPEELEFNGGERNYHAIGFNNSDKEYCQYLGC